MRLQYAHSDYVHARTRARMCRCGGACVLAHAHMEHVRAYLVRAHLAVKDLEQQVTDLQHRLDRAEQMLQMCQTDLR